MPDDTKPTATRLYPFVPSGPDFATSVAFFEAIGFETAWRDDGLAGLRFGGAYFILQDINIPVWQSNQMLTFEVTNLDAYWTTLASKDLATFFPGAKLKPPTDYPWGREIHIIDPAGVCWHIRQTAP